MSGIGQWIDKQSYWKLIIAIGLLILVSAVILYAWDLALSSKGEIISFGDSLYFSIISFTSLGYGDIVPVGFGKVICSLEVLLGLALVALLVGKIASERQSALLLLIYTAENQKKLQEFESKILAHTELIDQALDNHNKELVFDYARDGYNFLASISKYLVFHSDQGKLASFGNIPSLRKLYAAIIKLEGIAYEAIQTSSVKGGSITYFMRLIEKSDATARMMFRHHGEDKRITAKLSEIRSIALQARKWNNIPETERVVKFRKKVTPELIKRAKECIGISPIDEQTPHVVSKVLGVSVQLARLLILTFSENEEKNN